MNLQRRYAVASLPAIVAGLFMTGCAAESEQSVITDRASALQLHGQTAAGPGDGGMGADCRERDGARCTPSSGLSRAAAGDLRWEDRFDVGLGYGPEAIRTNSSDSLGGMLFLAGAFPFRGSPGSNADIHVRAYDIASGELNWENVWAPTDHDDAALGLAVAGRTIVVAGSTGLNHVGNNAFVIAGFAPRSGAIVWQDRCGTFSPSRTTALTADATRVFAAGNCVDPDGTNPGLLRAYQAATGVLLWEVRDASGPNALAVDAGRLFAVVVDGFGNLALRSYDAASGEQRWEVQFGPVFGPYVDATRIAARGDAVYVAWDDRDAGGTAARGLAAYDAASGAALWQTDPGERIEAMTRYAGRLLVAQVGGEALVRAYHPDTGAVLWQHQPATPETTYSARTISAAGGLVFVGGSSFTPASEAPPNLMVRALTLQGRFLWEDNEPTTAKREASTTNLVREGKTVIAIGNGGKVIPPFGAFEGWIRAYAARPALFRD